MKVGFFEEGPGIRSMMRLLSFLSFLAAVLITVIIIMTGESITREHLIIIGFFLLMAFAPKAAQKYAEMKIPNATP